MAKHTQRNKKTHQKKEKITTSARKDNSLNSNQNESDFLIDSKRLKKIIWRSLLGLAIFWGFFQTIDYIYWLFF